MAKDAKTSLKRMKEEFVKTTMPPQHFDRKSILSCLPLPEPPLRARLASNHSRR